MPGQLMTATQRLYQQWLQSDIEEEKASFEGELAAICITACLKRHLTPPFERREGSERTFWTWGYRSLPPWVYRWVSEELMREVPLEDGARYVGRRCVNALIDEIRCHQRRQRDAQVRRRQDDDPAEVERLRSGMLQVLADVGLPNGLTIPGDKRLLKRLIASYPVKLSNVSIARDERLSEGAIRKRRKRIAAICFGIADGKYEIRSVLTALGLKEGTKKWP